MGEEETQALTQFNSLVTNSEIAACFEDMAALLALGGLEQFKLRAYYRAAQSIANQPVPLVDLYRQGRLRDVRGVGESFALKIEAILRTGTCPQLERLRQEYPAGLLELMRVPGVGPKLAVRLWQELGVADLAQLAAAAQDGRMASLAGLGPKRAAAVLAGISSLQSWGGRVPIGQARPLAGAIVRELLTQPGVIAAEAAGSLRRGRETVGDLDVVVATDEPAALLKWFAVLPAVVEVISLGDTRASVRLKTMTQVDVRAVSPAEYAAALLYFTGSKEHNVRLRELAKNAGLKLNEYGLFRSGPTGHEPQAVPAVATGSEADIYEALAMQFVPPELREDAGEIEAALAHSLPSLLAAADIRGDLHSHTVWSDGTDSVAAMGQAATAGGLAYLAITDHSRALAFAGGLTVERLHAQGGEIRAWNAGHPGQSRLLWGCEVEIMPDGSLDLPDEVLAQLDWVVAAVHSPNRRGEHDLTARLLRAAAHPLVDVIAHPTGQLIGERLAYDIDMGALLAAAAEHGVALEINASPHRLDLPPHLARRAAELGVRLAISSDAHEAQSVGDLSFGVTAARRGWLRAQDALNTLSFEDLMAWRTRRRQGSGG